MLSTTSTPPIRQRAVRSAFTLIELVAVMVIVAVLAATAVPAVNSIGDTRRASAANQLLRDLTVARQHAQATGAATWVVFDAAAQKWSILIEEVDDPGRANATPLIDPGTGRAYETVLGTGVFAGAAIESVNVDGQNEIGFDWRGRPLNANEQPLSAQGSIALTGGHTVRVEAGTGHVMK